MLCQEDERVVAPDNTVVVGGQLLQIERQPGRRTCAGLRVRVRQHLDGPSRSPVRPTSGCRYTVVTRATTRPSRPVHTTPSAQHPGMGRWP